MSNSYLFGSFKLDVDAGLMSQLDASLVKLQDVPLCLRMRSTSSTLSTVWLSCSLQTARVVLLVWFIVSISVFSSSASFWYTPHSCRTGSKRCWSSRFASPTRPPANSLRQWKTARWLDVSLQRMLFFPQFHFGTRREIWHWFLTLMSV